MMYHNMITDIQEFTGNPPYSISPYSTGKASNRLHGPWGPFNLAFLGPDLYVANNADGTVSAILPTEGQARRDHACSTDRPTPSESGDIVGALDETLQSVWARWAFDLCRLTDGQADVDDNCKQTRRWFMETARAL
jgi:hypothetical protein